MNNCQEFLSIRTEIKKNAPKGITPSASQSHPAMRHYHYSNLVQASGIEASCPAPNGNIDAVTALHDG
jgi:hypothetical protein